MEKQIKKEVSQSKYSRIDSTCPILSSPANPQTSEQQPALAFTKNFEKYEVISKNENIQKELKCIEWRSKTELPIVKILFYKLLCSKIINCFVVQIGIQKFTSSLQALPTLPFYQVVYLLKESMVGFQRLFDRFGSFEVNGKMVFINKLGRCKVWFNQNVTLNYPSKKVKISQIDFKNQIVKIFEEKCISSTLSRDLFDKLKKAEKLIETINLIEYFSMEKKLRPPNKITAMYGSLGAKRISNENGTQDFTLSKSLLQKPPQFIKDIREKANLKTRKYTDCSIKSVIVKKTISTRNITEETPKSSHNATNPQSTCERKSSVERNVEEKSLKSEEAKGKLKLFKHTKNSLSANIISANAPAKQIGQPKNNSSKQANFVQPGQALHRTKIQKSQQPFKLRKFSQNVESLKTRTFLQRDTNEKQKPKEAMEKQKEEPKEENCKTKMIVSEPMNELRFTFSQKNQVAAKQIYESTPQYNLLNRYGIQNHEDLIIKNGWLKRINSLTLQSFRDTVNSISDGNETLAEHLTLPHIELELLKNMGKELRGSLLINAE